MEDIIYMFQNAKTVSYETFLFSFKGRVSRKDYWLFFFLPYILLVPVLLIAILMISAALNLSTADMNGLLRIGDLLLLASVYPLIAVTVKRLHDFNKSWFYAVFFFLSPVF